MRAMPQTMRRRLPTLKVGALPVRAFNFSPGPAALPTEVLDQVREELLDWNGSGMSVMEISHRSTAFLDVAAAAEADLRNLLAIPDDYRVLFLQGGASAQFSLVPMNLTTPGATVDYLDTGFWSKRAIAAARRYCRVHIAADAGGAYTGVPRQDELSFSGESAYVHYTSNETIGGVEFGYIPETRGVPLVADMSSNILSRSIEVSRFGLIYAGAQKNIGPAGLTIVIVREQLLGRARAETPGIFDYRQVADQHSMLNTPPTFAWYVAGLVFKWLRKRGGLGAMQEVNRRKAARLYAAIDSSSLYRNAVAADARSWMNVVFALTAPALETLFLERAEQAGLRNLRGHRAVGGMRASIYNSMPPEGVEALIDFMQQFERQHH
jgi:phosphoserine aminotransferase